MLHCDMFLDVGKQFKQHPLDRKGSYLLLRMVRAILSLQILKGIEYILLLSYNK